jgi:hypothetical protein
MNAFYNFVLLKAFLAKEMIRGQFMSDHIIPYPNPRTPWNLIFATKEALAAFLISAQAFYIISKSKRQK